MGKTSETFLLILLAIIIPPLAVGLVRGLDTQFWINLILFILLWPIAVIHAIVIVCGGKPKVQEGTAPNAYPNQVQNPSVVTQQNVAAKPKPYQAPYSEPENVAYGVQSTGKYPVQKVQATVTPAVPYSSSVTTGESTAPEIQRKSSVDKLPPAYE